MNTKIVQKILAKTREDYEIIAQEFAQSRYRVWPELEKLSLHIKEGQKVLDVGCGNGRLFQLFKNRSIEYTGIDNCRALIKEAQAKYPEANFQLMDALDLKFPSENFDAAFVVAVISHLPSGKLRQQLLQEVRRTLKKDGFLVITAWNLWQLNFRRKSFWRFWIDNFLISRQEFQIRYSLTKKDIGLQDILTVWQKDRKRAVLYYYAFTLRQLGKLVKDSGFEILEAAHLREGQKTHWTRAYNLVILARRC